MAGNKRPRSEEEEGPADLEALQQELDSEHATLRDQVFGWLPPHVRKELESRPALSPNELKPQRGRPPRLGLGAKPISSTTAQVPDHRLKQKLLGSTRRREADGPLGGDLGRPGSTFADRSSEDEEDSKAMVLERPKKEKHKKARLNEAGTYVNGKGKDVRSNGVATFGSATTSSQASIAGANGTPNDPQPHTRADDATSSDSESDAERRERTRANTNGPQRSTTVLDSYLGRKKKKQLMEARINPALLAASGEGEGTVGTTGGTASHEAKQDDQAPSISEEKKKRKKKKKKKRRENGLDVVKGV